MSSSGAFGCYGILRFVHNLLALGIQIQLNHLLLRLRHTLRYYNLWAVWFFKYSVFRIRPSVLARSIHIFSFHLPIKKARSSFNQECIYWKSWYPLNRKCLGFLTIIVSTIVKFYMYLKSTKTASVHASYYVLYMRNMCGL